MNVTNLIKYNKVIYGLYYAVTNTAMNIIKIFVQTNKKLILFNSFAGRKFDDSPKEIYEAMKQDPRFMNYELVWAFHDPSKFAIEDRKISTNSLGYFITAMRAKVWITNSSVERGLHFKKDSTFFLNTWHGTPIKRMGNDIACDNESFGTKGKGSDVVMMSQGPYETNIHLRCFHIPKENFLEKGYPRNDILSKYSEQYRMEIRERLNIPDDKKVILYCPTFREFKRDVNGCVMKPPIQISEWKKNLESKFILFFRAHYEVVSAMSIEDNIFARNMTDYPVLNDLIIASDVLISDYSSIFFDYSITGKPMLYFTYDFDEYSEKRGIYFDIRNYLNGAETEFGVITALKELDWSHESKRSISFRKEFIGTFGNATQAALDCIWENLQKN